MAETPETSRLIFRKCALFKLKACWQKYNIIILKIIIVIIYVLDTPMRLAP